MRSSRSRHATSTGVHLVAASRVTARDIMDTSHVIATREAIEKLQETLA